MPEYTIEELKEEIEKIMLGAIKRMVEHPEKFEGVGWLDWLTQYVAIYKNFTRKDIDTRMSVIGNDNQVEFNE